MHCRAIFDNVMPESLSALESAETKRLWKVYGLVVQFPSPVTSSVGASSEEPGTKDCWQEYWSLGV